MMKTAACLVLCLCVLEMTLVDSGVIFDGIKSGVAKTKCGLHKFGNLIVGHQHNVDPCMSGANQIDRDGGNNYGDGVVIDVRGKEDATTISSKDAIEMTTAGGKRLIAVHSNCPSGQRADKSGKCREQY